MEIEGVDFLESLKILADRAGVEVEKIDKKQQNERLRLLQLMDESAKFYETELRKTRMSSLTLKKRDDGRDGQIFWRRLRAGRLAELV